MWRRAKSAAHGRRTALPVRGDAARAHGVSAAPASSRTSRRSLVDAATGQVTCVIVLANGHLVSGSRNGTLKVWVDVEHQRKMARLVAVHHLHGMNVAAAERLIAKFL